MASFEYSKPISDTSLNWVNDLSAFIGNVVKFYHNGEIHEQLITEDNIVNGTLECRYTSDSFFRVTSDLNVVIGVIANSMNYRPYAFPIAVCYREVAPLNEMYIPDTIATKAYVDQMLGVIENGTY
jgi:hypothetical protein